MKRNLILLCGLLAAASCTAVDPVNSARYYQEIEPIPSVILHVQEDRLAGKSDKQIASDLGWAALQRILAYLNQPVQTQPAR